MKSMVRKEHNMKRAAVLGMVLVLLLLSITPVLADDATGNRFRF